MNDYYQKSMKALQLAGMSERTQESYARSVCLLVDFCKKAPDQISEAQLEDYFIHCQNVKEWAPATMRVNHSGIKFWFIRQINT